MGLTIAKNTIIENKYRIQELIGEGGMSVVFRAEDLKEKNPVAIKFLKPGVVSSYIEDIIRFKKEVEVVSRFDHPGIVRFYETGEYQNVPFLVTEIVEGKSLDQLMKEGKRFGIEESAGIISQLCEILSYVHSRGIIHRDIKPGNIVVSAAGGKIRVKLLDFGLSLVMELSQIKGAQEIVGTFGYMSPEATGMVKKPIDERSDLYSLGVVFYYLLSGEIPFKSTEIGRLIHEQVAVSPLPLRKLKPDIPQVLDEIVHKLLFKEQELRYQSSQGLLYDLQRFLKGEKEFIISEKDQKIKLTYQTKLIGREEEIAVIKRAFDRAQNGQGSIYFIGGEPGIGKTRLVETVQEYAYQQGYEKGGLFIRGRCLNQENKIPYQPFRDSLNEYISKMEKLDPDRKGKEISRLKKNMGELGENIYRLNPGMKALFGKMPDLIPLEPEKENQRFLITVSGFFCRLADEGQVCILFLDDLQWGDESSFRLLESISQEIGRSHLLILGTYRNTEVDQKHSLVKLKEEASRRNNPVSDIVIGALSHERLNRMVAGLLGEKEESALSLSRYIGEKTKGNPFFTITLVRELVEQKAIVWEDGVWTENWDKINGLKIPVNIIDMILLKIRDISSDLDMLLRVASVIGREFDLELLYRVLPQNKETIIGLVDEAVSLQLLELSIVEKGKVIFVHDRIKEAFFSRMKEDELRRYHHVIAQTLEERYRGREEEIIFELAHHYIEAGDEEKSMKYAYRAGERSRQNYAIVEAMKYFSYVKDLLVKKGDQSGLYPSVLENLGEMLRLNGMYKNALDILRELLTYARNDLFRARVNYMIGSVLFGMGKSQEAISILEETLGLLKVQTIPKTALGVFLLFTKEMIIQMCHLVFPRIFINEKFKNDEVKIRASNIYHVLGMCYYFIDMIKSGVCILIGINLADKMAHSLELGFNQVTQAPLWVSVNNFFMAEKYAHKGLDTALSIKNKWLEGIAYMYLNFVYFAYNKMDRSLEYGLKSIETLLSVGEQWELAVSFCMTWRVYYLKGDLKTALRHTARYVQLMSQVKAQRTLAWSIDHYSRAITYLKGCDEECLNNFKKSLSIASDINESPNTIMIYASLVMAYTQRGELNKAIEEGEKGMAMFKKTPAKGFWALDIFGYTAGAYLAALEEKKPDKKQRRHYFKRSRFCVSQAIKRGRIFKPYWSIALRMSGKYHWLRNNKSRALLDFQSGIRFCEKMGYKYELALHYFELGKFLFTEGFNRRFNREKGRGYLVKARELFESIGTAPDLEKTNRILGIKNATEPSSEVTPQDRLKLERRMDTVLNTSRYLSSILDLDELLQKIMDKTIELVGAERGILALYPDRDDKKEMKLEVKVVRNVRSDDTDTFQMSRSILERVTNSLKPIIIDDASTHVDFKAQASVVSSGFKSVLCAPIITKGELLGVIYLDNHLVSGLFHEEDLRILELISSQAGVSIENARLYKKSIDKQRMEQDMAIAGAIQKMFLPDKIEQIRDIEVDAVYSPAEFIGGDYYDIIRLSDNRTAVIIVDISGHGSSAAIVMSVISFIVHSVAEKVKNSAELASILNKRLTERLKAEKYATGIILIYDASSGFFEYTNAGHSSILLYQKDTDRILELESRCMPVGVNDDTDYITEKFAFKKGDILLLQTDGIFETMNDGRVQFGFDRVKKLMWNMREATAREINGYILSETKRFRGNLAQADDITLITLKKKE